ncbi:nucleotide 5'-monophosphate nucleosidase PpnN [Psychromonas sp. 14N.309.X.WAT.B.A12]|uniref:nucleotide 5'-monophosphate nucleosidase PpnN n=1 Tax=unclassified Psychromonas TaxID=2614957 RepID=UPI0025B1E930|nr:nucleotide 5'-monophosphate nucleosidase PpnN [Psychromonas sp. 14N.309.X.WAT.B.A12]MDN2663002.1 nucleotide 5'-monophosphate nucleosidase PpnN [Psychromonas sp. 14N.309.X.WAT.B.A12]
MISHISPVGSMALLSQLEVNQLKYSASCETYQLFRNCALAVLKSGSHTDSSKEILEKHKDFQVNVLHQERGVILELINPPEDAYIDGELIKGMQDLLFSVLRDILYVNTQLQPHESTEFNSEESTSLVFSILRNANILKAGIDPNMVVCWGGHSINKTEFSYTREVGNQLGLRELNICTGCGPGAMEGPMKGAAVGHAKQRVAPGRYIGLTEPGIIAAEPPNPIVNELVILPDIEKRLEAFVRFTHSIIIFPGGPGTAEELLYILGIMMHPENKRQPLPIILTGPASSVDYFEAIDDFIVHTLGPEAQEHYQIIIDDAPTVAKIIKKSMHRVKEYRKAIGDAYSFNWALKIDRTFQEPFIPNHQNMANLVLHHDQPKEQLASNLRRVFSGIVGGNVKDEGIKSIEENGPFLLTGEKELMLRVDKLLKSFIDQGRMKLPGSVYTPCYKITT